MAEVKFKDNTVVVEGALLACIAQALEEAAGELESQVKRNTKVDTGQTKNSWQHVLSLGGNRHEALVGSPLMNAVWEEFGTGEYALNGNGRKGGWFYKDEKGKGHFTHGKQPRRPLWKAYTTLKPRIIRRMQDVFKGGM